MNSLNQSNNLTKDGLVRLILACCALYYFVAAFAHFFGLTLFPFYDETLYSPYHDILLGLCDLVFVMIFSVVAFDPVNNIDTFHVILIAFVLVILVNIGLIWKFDFALYHSVHKQFQTIVETLLAFITLVSLWILRPATKKMTRKH